MKTIEQKQMFFINRMLEKMSLKRASKELGEFIRKLEEGRVSIERAIRNKEQ